MKIKGKKLYNYVFNEFNWIEILIVCNFFKCFLFIKYVFSYNV